jgi:DNA-binding NarL/FixJ family response regulator
MSTKGKKTVVLCDDHPIINDALEGMLQQHAFEVRRKCTDSTSLLAYYKSASSDILICDLNIDHTDTFQVLKSIHSIHPKLKIIVFTAYGEEVFIKKAQQSGVSAYILKDSSYDEILEAIKREETAFYTNFISHKTKSKSPSLPQNEVVKFRLSEREKSIISLVLKGKTSEQIGQLLFISKLTVDTHRKNIHKKIGVSGFLNLQEFARKFGIE